MLEQLSRLSCSEMLKAYSIGKSKVTSSTGNRWAAFIAGLLTVLATLALNLEVWLVVVFSAFSALIGYVLVENLYGFVAIFRQLRQRSIEINHYNSPRQVAERFKNSAFQKGERAAQNVRILQDQLDHLFASLTNLRTLEWEISKAISEVKIPYRGDYHFDNTSHRFVLDQRILGLFHEAGLGPPEFNRQDPPPFQDEPRLDEYTVKRQDSVGPFYSIDRLDASRSIKRNMVRSPVAGYTEAINRVSQKIEAVKEEETRLKIKGK